VLHKFGWQLLFAKHAGSDCRCDRRLKVCRRISFPYFLRSVLMESMHELVELERINFAAIPTIEMRAKLAQGFAQVTIMGDPRPFSNQASDPLRNFLHRSVWLTTLEVDQRRHRQQTASVVVTDPAPVIAAAKNVSMRSVVDVRRFISR
jgi:hypothetical protein